MLSLVSQMVFVVSFFSVQKQRYMSNYCQGKEKTYSPRILNVWLNYAKCHVGKIALSVSLCVKRLRNICSYLGHEIPVG